MNHLIIKAVNFAAEKHKKQRRKDADKTPYINHPISVAMLISDIGEIDDPEILAAALLHDTIEDTTTSPQELEKLFGERVRSLVEELTDDKNLEKGERKNLQVSHATKLTPDAVLIKLGDKISNVRDIIECPPVGWDRARQQEYFDWAEAVIANCAKVNTALEKKFEKVLARGRAKLLSSNKNKS